MEIYILLMDIKSTYIINYNYIKDEIIFNKHIQYIYDKSVIKLLLEFNIRNHI